MLLVGTEENEKFYIKPCILTNFISFDHQKGVLTDELTSIIKVLKFYKQF
jgi:hypothetical protein